MVPSAFSELWCGIHNDPVLRCFVNREGLNYEDLLEGVVPELGELANSLRLSTEGQVRICVQSGSPFKGESQH
jgi:hypothetical protein